MFFKKENARINGKSPLALVLILALCCIACEDTSEYDPVEFEVALDEDADDSEIEETAEVRMLSDFEVEVEVTATTIEIEVTNHTPARQKGVIIQDSIILFTEPLDPGETHTFQIARSSTPKENVLEFEDDATGVKKTWVKVTA